MATTASMRTSSSAHSGGSHRFGQSISPTNPPPPRKRRTEPELVEIIPGVSIPQRFARTVSAEHGSWTVEIVTDPNTKIPKWVQRCEHASGGGEPVAAVSDDPWRRRMEDAIAHQAASIASRRFTAERGWAIGTDFEKHFPDVAVPADAPRIDQAVIDAADEAARQAVRPKPGRPPVGDEEKLAALELYRAEKTVAEIAVITGKSERTIGRWLHDARELEGGSR